MSFSSLEKAVKAYHQHMPATAGQPLVLSSLPVGKETLKCGVVWVWKSNVVWCGACDFQVSRCLLFQKKLENERQTGVIFRGRYRRVRRVYHKEGLVAYVGWEYNINTCTAIDASIAVGWCPNVSWMTAGHARHMS